MLISPIYSKILFILKNLRITLKFYYFLVRLGILKEYINACRDNNINGNYEGVLRRLNRGTDSSNLIIGAFSFPRQMYVKYSNTDWWAINHAWNYSIVIK